MHAEHRIGDLKTRAKGRRRVTFVPEQRTSHTGAQVKWTELEPAELVQRATIVKSHPELGIQAGDGIAGPVTGDVATEVRERIPGDLLANPARGPGSRPVI